MSILILLLCNTILDSGSTSVIIFIYYLYNSLFSVMFFVALSILVIMFLFKSYACLINCLLMVFYICYLAILYLSDTFSGYYNCMNIVIEIVNLPIYICLYAAVCRLLVQMKILYRDFMLSCYV